MSHSCLEYNNRFRQIKGKEKERLRKEIEWKKKKEYVTKWMKLGKRWEKIKIKGMKKKERKKERKKENERKTEWKQNGRCVTKE